MHWMGYIYRLISVRLALGSAKTFELVKHTYLRKVFLSYHCYDPEKVVEIIKQDLNIKSLTKSEKIRLILK